MYAIRNSTGMIAMSDMVMDTFIWLKVLYRALPAISRFPVITLLSYVEIEKTNRILTVD